MFAHLAALAAAVRLAELEGAGALGRLGAPLVLAPPPAAVRDAERRRPLRCLLARLALAPFAAAVRDAVWRRPLRALRAPLRRAPAVGDLLRVLSV
eukprot:1282874-Pyramimonas_sp.AAC.1